MQKLLLDDDGSVVVPMANGVTHRLTEPTLAQLVKIREILAEADRQLDDLGGTDGVARAQAAYTPGSPHAVALAEVIEMLQAEATQVDLDQFYGWAGNPGTIAKIHNHFCDPLGGRDSAVNQLMQMVTAASSLAPTADQSPSSANGSEATQSSPA